MDLKKSIECWIYNTDIKKFLLLKCPVTEKHGEYWQPVTGGIDAGEPVRKACTREIQEETSLQISYKHIKCLVDCFSVWVPQSDMELQKTVFVTKTSLQSVCISSEHIGYQWAPPEEVPALLLWDSHRFTFGRVSSYLGI